MDNTYIYLLYILFRSYLLFFSLCKKLYIYLPTDIHLSSFSFQMVCSDRTVFSCDNLCGNPLPCGNHYCTKVCHALVSSTKLYGSRRPESCEECTLPCQQVLIYFLSISSVGLTSFFFWGLIQQSILSMICLVALSFWWLHSFISWHFMVCCSGMNYLLLLIIFRKENLLVVIHVPCVVILENAPLAKHW